MIVARCNNIHQDLESLSEELYGLSRFHDCEKLNEVIKKFKEDFCKKNLERNDEDDNTNGITNELHYSDDKMENRSVANQPEAGNVDKASQTAHSSSKKMTKNIAKRGLRKNYV